LIEIENNLTTKKKNKNKKKKKKEIENNLLDMLINDGKKNEE
jgi:hypothetical protein